MEQSSGLDGGSNQLTTVAEAPARGHTGESVSYVYAIGTIEPRFPSRAVEKEMAQAIGRAGTVGLNDSEALKSALQSRQNRYLLRQLCWVLTIENLETYILRPRDPVDFDLLLNAVRPVPAPTDVDVVIGVRGPIAPAEMCNGLLLPIVIFDQIYSFGVDDLIREIPRPKSIPENQDERFRTSAKEVLDRVLQMADNAGATDEHRAVNYLAVRYPTAYGLIAEGHQQNLSLTGLEVRPSRLSVAREIVDVIITLTDRQTDVTSKHFVRVDVTEEFPFVVSKMSPYYDR